MRRKPLAALVISVLTGSLMALIGLIGPAITIGGCDQACQTRVTLTIVLGALLVVLPLVYAATRSQLAYAGWNMSAAVLAAALFYITYTQADFTFLATAASPGLVLLLLAMDREDAPEEAAS